MKSLYSRLEKIKQKNQLWSSYACFAVAIKNQKFSKKIIYFWFNKLVNKDDYSKEDKRRILRHLFKLSNNTAEAGIKR